MSTINFGSKKTSDLHVDGWLVPEDQVRAVIFCPSWHTLGRVTKSELFLGQAPESLSAGDDTHVHARCPRDDCPTREFYLISMSRLREFTKNWRRGKLRINVTAIGEALPPLGLDD